MAECLNNIISADIQKNCDKRPKGGLENDVVVIPWADVDWVATTFDAQNPLLCTDLKLKSGKTGFKIEGLKSTNKAFFEKATDDYGSFYKHKYTGVLVNPTAENRHQLYNLLNEEAYVIVVEKKWKGANDASAFIVLGKDNGLYGGVHTYGSDDNNGVEVFEMATDEKESERYPALNLLETDYATTKAAFDNKFATA